MSPQSDLDINRQVRSIMVRHWIDLGRLSIRTISGRVTVRGILERIPGIQDELTTSLVEQLFGELGRLRDVRRVVPELDNWTNAKGLWQRVGASSASAGASSSGEINGPATGTSITLNIKSSSSE